MIKASDIIHLSARAFWDIDMNKLDYETKAGFIIQKVFDNGSLEDIMEVTACYGKEKVRAALLAAEGLKESTKFFSSLFLNIPLSQFRCYNTRQFHPVH